MFVPEMEAMEEMDSSWLNAVTGLVIVTFVIMFFVFGPSKETDVITDKPTVVPQQSIQSIQTD